MTTPSNEAIGQLIGVSHATVSRYKSGDRLPELDNMAKIAEVFEWSLDDQYEARQKDRYAEEFNERVRRMATDSAGGTLVKKTASNQ